MSLLRSYRHHGADPWFNMAFDETMLGDVIRRPELVYVRLYTWSPGAITLGVNQEVTRAVRLDRLGDTPLLRRVTGGRAVYHDPGELTYAIALNLENPALADWGRSVSEVYLRLAEGLRRFLGRIGVTTQIVRRSAGARPVKADLISAPCFESVARYELVAEGGKVLASAQRQVGRAMLQHGSVKLHGLVAHPALPGRSQAADPLIQPIEATRLDTLSAQFNETFLEWFGIPRVNHTHAGDPPDGWAERLTLVQSDPLGRRVLVER